LHVTLQPQFIDLHLQPLPGVPVQVQEPERPHSSQSNVLLQPAPPASANTFPTTMKVTTKSSKVRKAIML